MTLPALPVTGADVRSPQAATRLVATRPYVPAGASQHLTVIHDGESQVLPNPTYTPLPILSQTVLASVLFPRTEKQPLPPVDVYLPLPDGGTMRLPSLSWGDLRPQAVTNQAGQQIGKLCAIPALHTQANQLLSRRFPDGTWDTYDYAAAVEKMILEAGRLLARVLKQGVIRVRQKPGLMAHLVAEPALRYDEVGISLAFAHRLFAQLRPLLPLHLMTVGDLDGLPTWTIRFPLANRFGVQRMVLRILPGRGRYVAANPWVIGKRYLGDEDGDQGFVLPMVEGLQRGEERLESRPKVEPADTLLKLSCPFGLQSFLSMDGFSEKQRRKAEPPVLTTRGLRLKAIQNADTRGHVAIYTMAVGWWLSRVLATHPESGVAGPAEAHMLAYDALEWLMEACMDARKGESAFETFDSYGFMETLMQGGVLPSGELERIGMPAEALQTLSRGWILSGGNLRRYCGQSPVYGALVLRRNQMEQSVPDMLTALRQLGIPPWDVYRAVVDDLACIMPLEQPALEADLADLDDDRYGEEGEEGDA